MELREFLEESRERVIHNVITSTEKLFKCIEDDNKTFFKKYSNPTLWTRCSLETNLNMLKNINKSIEEIEMLKRDDYYKQIISLDEITFQLTLNEIPDSSFIAKYILALPYLEEKLLSCMAEGKAEMVREEMKNLKNVSEQELREIKEEFLQIVVEVVEKRKSRI